MVLPAPLHVLWGHGDVLHIAGCGELLMDAVERCETSLFGRNMPSVCLIFALLGVHGRQGGEGRVGRRGELLLMTGRRHSPSFTLGEIVLLLLIKSSSWHCLSRVVFLTTVRVDSLPHGKWKEIKQQPGTAGPGNMLGCCLIFLHFPWGKLSTRTVENI